MIDLKSNLKKSLLACKFDGNLYSLCNYDGKGLLVDIINSSGGHGGEKLLARELKLLVPFMYCNGKGVAIKETILTNGVEPNKKIYFAKFHVCTTAHKFCTFFYHSHWLYSHKVESLCTAAHFHFATIVVTLGVDEIIYLNAHQKRQKKFNAMYMRLLKFYLFFVTTFAQLYEHTIEILLNIIVIACQKQPKRIKFT